MKTENGNRVLLISHRDDVHAYAVRRKLHEITGEEQTGMVFDTATFPIASRIAIGSEPDIGCLWAHPALPEVHGNHIAALLKRNADCQVSPLRLNEVRAVFWRRPRPNIIDEALTHPDLRAYASKASRETVEGTIEAMALHCRTMDPPSRVARASLKLLQLELAGQAGFHIARTLVTNSPDQARAFIDRIHRDGREVISKSPSDLHYFAARTEIVDARKLGHLDGVQLSPTILQERVAGGPDLRITVVGRRLFAMAQTAREPFAVDGRLDPAPHRESMDLPVDLRDRILDFQARLGLSVGAYDFKCDAAGTAYFLEVNPVGQWLGTEISLGLPIAESIALHLWHGPGAEWRTERPAIREDELGSLLPPAVRLEYDALAALTPHVPTTAETV